jgi:tryptophan-rich sensory protein
MDVNYFLPKDPAQWILWICSFILTILFLVASFIGAKESWYVNLPVKSNENSWLIAGLWVVASLLSYLAFYIVRDYDEEKYGQSRLLPLFLIVSYLNVLWVILFFKFQSFTSTIIILAVIFAVQFYIMIFLLYINAWAFVVLIPLQVLYGYLIYSIFHLASINNIVI